MSWLFVVVLSLVLLSSIGALRVNTQDNFIAEGTITEEIPESTTIDGKTVYNISTAGNLKYLSNHSELWGEHFQQTDNIIYTESTWNPIGNATTPFTGSYAGHYFTITFTQEINVVDVKYFGLFGCAEFGYVPVFIDVGQGCWGVGVNWQGGLNVKNSNFGDGCVGGLVGFLSINGTYTEKISFCYTEGKLTIDGAYGVGGLVGVAIGNTISNCYTKMNFVCGTRSIDYLGGICGYCEDIIVENCYNMGSFKNFNEQLIIPGGIVCYNPLSAIIEKCFYNKNAFINSTDCKSGGTPLTLDEMKVKSLYTDAGWDFTYWAIDETNKLINDGLPYISGFLRYVSGSGTEQDKFKISDERGLKTLATQSMIWNCHFEQTANIEYTDNAWNPIGNATTQFTGSYDGGGHNIKFTKSVLIEGNAGDLNAGLFGYISGSTISNLGVDWAGTDYISLNENQYKGLVVLMPDGSSDCGAGGIVGKMEDGSIGSCYNIGNVTVYGGYAGGIVGTGNGLGRVGYCYNRGDITAIEPNVSSGGAGGIVADYQAIVHVESSYNTGLITVTGGTADSVYGIGGYAINCFTIGTTPVISDVRGGSVDPVRGDNCYHNYKEFSTDSEYEENLEEYVKELKAFTPNDNLTWSYPEAWYDYGTNTNVNDGYPILRDLSNVTVTYKVDKNYNSETVTQNYNFAESANITLKGSDTFTKEGYYILKWADDTEYTEDTKYYDCNSAQLLTEDITLYPVWEVSEYDLTFDQDGGTGGATNTTITNGDALASNVAVPTKTGYTFLGYYSADTQFYNGQGVLVNTSYVVSGPLTLTAKWQANTYNLTFNQNGGQNGATTTTITYGQKLPDSVSVPTRDKYTFLGYYLNDTQFYNASGELVNTSYNVTGALELTAKWVSNYATVTFNITTNVGVIFNVYDNLGNFVQQIYVAKGSGQQTITTQLLKGATYTIRMSANYTTNIVSVSGATQQGRELSLTISDSGNTVTIKVTGFSGGNGIIV